MTSPWRLDLIPPMDPRSYETHPAFICELHGAHLGWTSCPDCGWNKLGREHYERSLGVPYPDDGTKLYIPENVFARPPMVEPFLGIVDEP